jgi:signal transduction histidine kinase/CheY-like chemotaxis protein
MRSLLSKFTLLQLLFVLLVGSAVYYWIEREQEGVLRAAFVAQGRSLAGSVSKALEPALTKGNRAAVQSAMETACSGSNIEWAYVLSPDHRVVAHTFGSEVPQALLDVRTPAGQDWLDLNLPDQPRPLTLFSQPLSKGAPGTLCIGVNRQPLIESIRRMEMLLAARIGGAALLLLLLFLLVARALLSPIRMLAGAAADLKQGDADAFRWLPVRSNDELGEVTYAFSSLAAALHGRNDKMEERVAERTQELMRRNAELAIEIVERKRAERESLLAKEAAETANRAKSAFLANISHELRTPMNGILGTTELIQAAGLDRQQQEYFEIIRSSAQSLLGVINDILDFSKIEAGKFDLDVLDFDLPALVHETLKPLALKAEENGVELLSRIDPAVPDLVHGDPIRLRQVLTNLAGNAIKFTPKGEIEIAVGVESQEEKSDVLHFSVRDTGIGIPENQREAIFEPFRQADITMTRKFGGTGLGLSISSRLVHMMGGKIWVESEVGRGSTFHFTVRLEHATASTAAPIEGLEKHFSGLRVLVVDDNPTSRQILHEYLTRARMLAAVRPDAASAFEALLRAGSGPNPFDLVVAECHMRLEDGFALAHRIRATAALASLPILMLSSGVVADDRNRCLRLGIGVCLAKPVNERDLHAAVLRVLSQRAPEKTVPQPEQVVPAVDSTALHVLLAEDNKINQLIGVKLLEKLGHFVVVADDGRAAFEEVKKRHFDLVLMDLQMPEMDGYEATRAIRAWEKDSGHHIPIIAMTAHAMNRDKENCFAAGMDAHVAKPVNINELAEQIRSLLQPQSASGTDSQVAGLA